MSHIKWTLLLVAIAAIGCGGSCVSVGVSYTGDISTDPWGDSTGTDTTGGDTTGNDTTGSDSSGSDSTSSDGSDDGSDSDDDSGGGIDSTGDGVFDSSVSSGPTPAAMLRPNQVGDQFSYVILGTTSNPNGLQNIPVTGSATEVIASGGATGTLLDSLNVAVTASGARQFQSLQRIRTEAGQIVGETEAGTLQTVKAPYFTLPVSLSTAVSLNGLELLSNGASISESYKVLGYNTIKEAAGSFACWKVRESMTYSNGTSISRVSWVSPQLGGPVKEVIQTVFRSGIVQTITLRLQSTNVH